MAPDDAERFATLLQAEGFDLATPLLWDSATIGEFCDAGEFEVSLVQEVCRPLSRPNARPTLPPT